jgi:hypothetical protein
MEFLMNFVRAIMPYIHPVDRKALENERTSNAELEGKPYGFAFNCLLTGFVDR